MKKILIVMSVAILMALCSAPSFVHAAPLSIGQAYVDFGSYYISDIYIDYYSSTDSDFIPCGLFQSGNVFYVSDHPTYPTKTKSVYFYYESMKVYLNESNCLSGVISTLTNSYNWTYNNSHRSIFNNNNDFDNSLPPELQPSITEKRWNAFYEWYKQKFGFYPVEGSLIDLLRKLALGDEDANTEIVFPTLTPTPTPSPTPTTIPVQTIFVPDGNGNTTIIYQYPDPNTGVITQSPYNPNIQNNIEVNCDCDGDGSGNNIFGTEPTDPYTLTSSMLWTDGFGVEITDNPLTAANDSQKSLAEAAAEYTDSVNVVSNSFNVLPFKWLVLVGLLGGILIIAGLLRTFLGG